MRIQEERILQGNFERRDNGMREEETRSEVCPRCGNEMIDDAFEEFEILPDGSIQLDVIYPAWVCSKFCGYYERMSEN
jgi:hypothetical protein